MSSETAIRMHGFRRELVGCAVLCAILSLLSLVPALTVGVILDRVVSSRSFATLVAILLAFLFFHLCEIVFSHARERLLFYLYHAATERAERRFMSRLASLDVATLETVDRDQAKARFLSLEGHARFAVDWWVSLASLPVGLAVACAALLVTHTAMGVLILVVSLVYAGTHSLALRKQRRLAQAVQRARDPAFSAMEDYVDGLPSLKAHGGLAYWRARWGTAKLAQLQSLDAYSRIQLWQYLAGLGYERVVLAMILGLGAYEAVEGRLSIGQLVMLNMLFRQLASQLREFAPLFQRRLLDRTSRQALEAFWEKNSAMPRPVSDLGANESPGAALAVDGLCLTSAVGRHILDGVTFTLPEGCSLAVIGESGAGKSTLLKILSGLCMPTTGTVQVFGCMPRHSADLIYLSQKEFLFGVSVHDNVALGRLLPPGRVRDQLDALGLRVTQARVDGVGPKAHRAQLSGGERQRIFLARALAGRSRALFLDEPTTALDPHGRQRVMTLLKSSDVQTGLLVFSTHDLEMALAADYVLRLQQGKVSAFGPAKDVLLRSDALEEAAPDTC